LDDPLRLTAHASSPSFERQSVATARAAQCAANRDV